MGRLVEVTVDINESGDHGRFNSFTGTVLKTILGTFHEEYHIIGTKDKGYFMVGPRILGESLDWAFRTGEKNFWVGIARIHDNSILSKSEFSESDLESSQVEYYAIGTLRFL